jgi:hypothetical protein
MVRAASEVKRLQLQIHNGYICSYNGHSPTEKSVRSGVTVMMSRPWPVAKVDGYILVWESLTGTV